MTEEIPDQVGNDELKLGGNDEVKAGMKKLILKTDPGTSPG